jgi:putative PIN family toxin of toxin-antitoxin system
VKVVLDTNILVRAYPGATGPAKKLLTHLATSEDDHLATSPYILQELRNVLSRPRTFKRIGLGATEIDEFVHDISKVSEIVIPQDVAFDVLSDPDDLPVLGTALACNADAICTLDRAFYEMAAKQFCADRGIEVISDGDLIIRLKI